MKTLEQLKEQVLAVTEQVETTVERIFSSFTNKSIKVNSSIRRHYDWETEAEGYKVSGTIEFIKENGERDFGSDISFNYNTIDGLKVNVGTCGEYGMEDIYQVERVMFLARLFSCIALVESQLSQFDISIINEYTEARYNEEKRKRLQEQEEKEAQREEISNTLEEGQVYKDKYGKLFTLTKVMPKTIKVNDAFNIKKDSFIASVLNKELELVERS